jgi:hypothetical protein
MVGHAAERKVGEAGDIGFYPRRAEPTKKGGKQRTRERGRLLLLRLKITSSSFIHQRTVQKYKKENYQNACKLHRITFT